MNLGIALRFLGIFLSLHLFSIAVLLWIGVRQKRSVVRMMSAFGNVRPSRAMEIDFRVLLPHDSLTQAVDLTLAGSQRDFPVVEDGRLIGMLLQEDVSMALKQVLDQIPVAKVMRREFPVVDSADLLEGALNRLRTSDGSSVPVTHGGQLVGLLTMENARELLKIQSASRTQRKRCQSRPSFLKRSVTACARRFTG